MSDQAAFAKFEDGWEQDGVGKDGLPKYRPALIIRLSKPPYLEVRREATEEDLEHYTEPYKLYQKLRAGRDISEIEGFPLALWSAITKAEFEQLVAHGVLTVEQLAKIGERKGAVAAKVPEQIMVLAQRAKRMVELQKSQGRYEVIINELEGERDQLKEQVRELGQALSAANAQVNTLQMRIAGIGTMLPERAA